MEKKPAKPKKVNLEDKLPGGKYCQHDHHEISKTFAQCPFCKQELSLM